MARKMSYEEMRDKGLISEGIYEEITKEITDRINLIASILQKGDRIVITLKENYENNRFKRKHYLENLEEIELEVLKVREGINYIYDYYRFGQALFFYYTKKYADKHNVQREKVFNIIANVRNSNKHRKLKIAVNRIEKIEIRLNTKLDKVIKKAIDYCYLNSFDDDIIPKSIMKYKALRELSLKEQEQVYNMISSALRYQ